MFSFYSDDSYEPLPCGPDACVTRKKPLIVPSLNLDNLPEYETSSDEEEDAGGDGAGEDHKAAAAVILGALDTYMKGRYTNPDYVPAMNMQKIMTVDLQQYLLKEKTKRTGRTLDR